MKSREDDDFPSHDAFNKLGKKTERITLLLDFCNKNNQFSDVCFFLPKLPPQQLDGIADSKTDSESKAKGYVYLLQHGTRYEYKIGRTNNPIRREGELTIELPEKLIPIHWIETDDPAGIEKYWHSRFSKKRLNGEWFELSADDVRAFKRWKRIF
nr:GIY-YIG nuclease family protein [uncultured Deefgea sp.]